MTAATTIVHRYGVEFQPSHVVLAAVLLALVLLGVLLYGIHIGRTVQVDYTQPVEGATADPEDSCCALDPDHPGLCEFTCGTCMGSGLCIYCDGDNGLDDISWCDECPDGRCGECNGDGRFAEDLPEPFVPTSITREQAEQNVLAAADDRSTDDD